MTSDGTNSYLWDAANRMIKITYPGTNNFSSFAYDGLGRNVSIVETTAGSVTSTKQFVWARDKMRPYQACEERDGSGVLTKKFFDRGQMNSSTKYFYNRDHLGSIREMTDNTGVVQAQYSFDPYGQITKILETVPSDFGYAGYYSHSRSGLNLTLMRAYSSAQGRFINRDPIEETGGVNLYCYLSDQPVAGSDMSGMGPSDGTNVGQSQGVQGGASVSSILNVANSMGGKAKNCACEYLNKENQLNQLNPPAEARENFHNENLRQLVKCLQGAGAWQLVFTGAQAADAFNSLQRGFWGSPPAPPLPTEYLYGGGVR